jgi:hypothetical protein
VSGTLVGLPFRTLDPPVPLMFQSCVFSICRCQIPLSKYSGGDETFEPFPTLMSFIQGALRPLPAWP